MGGWGFSLAWWLAVWVCLLQQSVTVILAVAIVVLGVTWRRA